jgi:hypothetical protein
LAFAGVLIGLCWYSGHWRFVLGSSSVVSGITQ